MNSPFLSRFTPSLMTREALEVLFVQREELAQRIVELIRDSVLTRSKHHNLLIGPRGIGKTHLVSLVYHRVEAIDDFRDKLLIAWLREEEWGVTSFLDLLLRILRALREKYSDVFPSERLQALYNLLPEAAERQAALLLKEFIGGRTLLQIVENLDDLFDGLGDEGQKRLRAYLQDGQSCTILATAQSLFNGVRLQTSPFYGFFRIYHLEELEFEEAVLLLKNIAKFVGDEQLASFIQTPTGRARIRAVHHLAGGNHRIYVIFSEFLTCEALNELVEPFMRTLDDLTPYYQARISWLSPQQRKIMEFLFDRQGGVTVKEIAQHCFMTHQTAASQLKELREKEYVRSESIGRESYYELREPFMRLCVQVKKNRGEPIRLLVDFLRLWFFPTELHERLALLQPDANVERAYITQALELSKQEEVDPRLKACVEDCDSYMEAGKFDRALQAAEEIVAIKGDTWTYLLRGSVLGRMGKYEEALASVDKAIELEPNNQWANFLRGITLNKIERYEEALESFDKVIEINPKNDLAWFQRGRALRHLGRYEKALVSLNRAIKLKNDDADYWRERGGVLDKLGRNEEALVAYEKAIKLNSSDMIAWSLQGVMLGQLGRYEEALASSEKLIELDPKNGLAWGMKGLALISLYRYEEALLSCEKAMELGDKSPLVFFNRAEALIALSRWSDGFAALSDALSRFRNEAQPVTISVSAIINRLFSYAADPVIWRRHLDTLVELCRKYEVLPALWIGMVRTIPTLTSSMVSTKAAQAWLEVWRDLVGDRPEFQMPLRLVDAAVRYRETQDPRILLGLPSEERNLLKPLLGVEDPEEHKSEVSSSQPIPEQKELKPRRQYRKTRTRSLRGEKGGDGLAKQDD